MLKLTPHKPSAPVPPTPTASTLAPFDVQLAAAAQVAEQLEQRAAEIAAPARQLTRQLAALEARLQEVRGEARAADAEIERFAASGSFGVLAQFGLLPTADAARFAALRHTREELATTARQLEESRIALSAQLSALAEEERVLRAQALATRQAPLRCERERLVSMIAAARYAARAALLEAGAWNRRHQREGVPASKRPDPEVVYAIEPTEALIVTSRNWSTVSLPPPISPAWLASPARPVSEPQVRSRR